MLKLRPQYSVVVVEQVFSSTTVEADVAAKLLESFQDAEQLLRSGGSATATEVTEAAAVAGWLALEL